MTYYMIVTNKVKSDYGFGGYDLVKLKPEFFKPAIVEVKEEILGNPENWHVEYDKYKKKVCVSTEDSGYDLNDSSDACSLPPTYVGIVLIQWEAPMEEWKAEQKEAMDKLVAEHIEKQEREKLAQLQNKYTDK